MWFDMVVYANFVTTHGCIYMYLIVLANVYSLDIHAFFVPLHGCMYMYLSVLVNISLSYASNLMHV